MDLSVIEERSKPKVIYAGVIQRQPGDPFIFPLHRHEDHSELLLILEGRLTFKLNNLEYTVGPRTVICYPEGAWHEEASRGEEGFHMMYLGFSGLQLQGLPPNHLADTQTSPVIPLAGLEGRVRHYFDQIWEEQNRMMPEAQWISNQWMGTLIGTLCRRMHHDNAKHQAQTQDHKQTTDPVASAKRYIQEQYHEPLTLKDLARRTFLSPHHLCHRFKEETGISPIQYLIRYRMDVAKQYLTHTDYRMDRIADLVGYQSDTYFQSAFKKWTGFTPGEYRKLQSETGL
ncbi:hypothetical protein SY83_03445 [Paenibacillus swuensis]|uniref:HTH araC/xylS-type domain-containing protein n=1 Tax=Paenibacillus swuensis TaxID=1178515 RepID=A0A172TFG2_9BACL|nr:AraC family transcriptional regulator [Paenibacillus swuensis]ANE45523.1 hypothetical protein SY83_03445 [Paenibacillus swuensis]